MWWHRHPDIFQKLRSYLSGVVVYGFGLILYSIVPYYTGFISRTDVNLNLVDQSVRPGFELFFGLIGRNTYEVLWHLYVAYLIVGLFFFLLYPKADLQENRALSFVKAVYSFFKQSGSYLRELGSGHHQPSIQLTKIERVSCLFLLVKFIFLPIMLNFMFGNFESFAASLYGVRSATDNAAWTQQLYLAVLNGLYLIDTTFFAFGYMFEFASLKNKVRSVEPTFFGWVVALMCYPPLNDITGRYLPWGTSNYATFGDQTVTNIMLILATFCTMIYVWATLSLGTKSSNLTNRGIVTTGAYGLVRHPAYIAKNLSWFILAIPNINFHLEYIGGFPIINLNWLILGSVLGWMLVYFLRAVTEERHLMQDPDYQAYAKKVRYRFIPGVF